MDQNYVDFHCSHCGKVTRMPFIESPEHPLATPIERLPLSWRAYNCLKGPMRIKTVGELVQHTGGELLRNKHFGKKSLAEIRERLAELNLSLALDRETQAVR